MARIAGVNIPTDKRVEVALTYVFGIGPATSRKILESAKIDRNIRVKDLSEIQVAAIRTEIDGKFTVEGDLQRQVSQNIKRLRDIGSYAGMRHKANLPVHGQRTKTNARTKRGKRVTMGSGRKKSAAKT